MNANRNKELYRQSMRTKLSRNADQRVWSQIQGELQKQSSRGQWFQFSLAAGVLCALLTIVILRNLPTAPVENVSQLGYASEVDQMSQTVFEIDQELLSTQILAYDDFENMGVGSEYDF